MWDYVGCWVYCSWTLSNDWLFFHFWSLANWLCICSKQIQRSALKLQLKIFLNLVIYSVIYFDCSFYQCSFFYNLLLGKLSRIFENQRKDCHWAKGTCWICKVGLHLKFETLIIAKILSFLPLKGSDENSGRVYCVLPETLFQFSQRNAPDWSPYMYIFLRN